MRKILLAAVFVVPALAWAAPTTAGDWFKEGVNHYTLGNFDKAVDAFKRAFELETDESKRAAYVYNIAQSYRQANDCAKAQFFYRRFLSLKASDTVKPLTDKERKSAEDFIKDLEPCVQQAASLGKRPPEALQGSGDDKIPPPDASKDHKEPPKNVAVAPPGSGPEVEDDAGVDAVTRVRPSAPSVISARVTAGGTKVFAGSVDVPVQATFAGIVGYPIAINDKLTIEVGAAGTLTPIPFGKTVGTMVESNTAYLISAVADAGVVYELWPKLGARFDIGIGALFFSNVSGSKFIIEGGQADGALTMFHVRGALSVDYAATPNIVVTATPFAYSFSPPKDGMDKSIKALTSIDFMIGLGYRM